MYKRVGSAVVNGRPKDKTNSPLDEAISHHHLGRMSWSFDNGKTVLVARSYSIYKKVEHFSNREGESHE